MYICNKCKEEFPIDVSKPWSISEATEMLEHTFKCFTSAQYQFDELLLDSFFTHKG